MRTCCRLELRATGCGCRFPWSLFLLESLSQWWDSLGSVQCLVLFFPHHISAGRAVLRSREKGPKKTRKNSKFQNGKSIIQMHLEFHMTDVLLKNMCKLNHTLNSPGTLGI